MVNLPHDDYQLDIEPDDEAVATSRPGLLATLLILVMIVSLLGTLFWPLIWQIMVDAAAPPTPTPLFLREASVGWLGLVRIGGEVDRAGNVGCRNRLHAR